MTIITANIYQDGNEGLMGKLDYPIGNRRFGEKIHLSGTEVPILVANHTVRVGPVRIEGTSTGLYTTADAFGAKFSVLVPTSGVIQSVQFYDLDDEGVNTEIWLFNQDFTGTTDNLAFAVSDTDLLKVVSSILVNTFRDAASNQIGVLDNLGISYIAPTGRLWIQCVTRGGPTIAAGQEPFLAFTILSDD